MRRLLLILLTLIPLLGFSQEEDDENQEVKDFTATVINAQTEFPLESVHVVNLNQVKGTITNQNGKFSIPAAVNDTLYLSYLGFKTQKVRVTNDMLRFGNTEIALTELAYALEEVVVRPYQLTGYLEIDVKNLPINNAYQYSISGLNTSYEAGNKSPSAVTKVLGAILNPADLLRNLFGKNLGKCVSCDKSRKMTISETFWHQNLTGRPLLNCCNLKKWISRTSSITATIPNPLSKQPTTFKFWTLSPAAMKNIKYLTETNHIF